METKLIAQPLLPSELPADPVAWCRAFADHPGLALFDSALKDERLGRYKDASTLPTVAEAAAALGGRATAPRA